jgi:hypothetical protein
MLYDIFMTHQLVLLALDLDLDLDPDHDLDLDQLQVEDHLVKVREADVLVVNVYNVETLHRRRQPVKGRERDALASV